MKKPFYGWYLLASLTLAYTVSNGLVLNSLPIFYPELVREFGWNQSEVTRPAQLLFLLVAVLSPFAGILLDRFSTRHILLTGAGLMTLGIFAFSRMSTLMGMSAIYLLFSVSLVLCGIISSMYLLTRWFVRYRGIAVGIFLLGSSLGGAIFNPLAAYFIQTMGWRSAAMTLAVLAVGFLVLPLFLFVRNTPQEMNLQPDGLEPALLPATNGSTASNSAEQQGPTLQQIIRTPTFYLILIATAAMWFTILGVVQHQALYLKDLGGSLPVGSILGLFFACSLVGKVFFGWLSDRFEKRYIMQLATLNMVLGSLLLYLSHRNPQVLTWAYAVVFGIGFSGTFTIIQVLIADFYSGRDYGKILGTYTMIDTLAGVGGISFLGFVRSSSGSYQQGFLVMLILCTLAAICIPFLRKSTLAANEH
ncbi:MAG: MFS transporter [Saprospiraceae bacterium]|nr:MFS transporter [Saprospiraceae bacterium]MDW8483271.1 MFS transporter [Saprospiraceae bacterium]